MWALKLYLYTVYAYLLIQICKSFMFKSISANVCAYIHIMHIYLSIYLSLNHIYILYIIIGSMSEKFLETT
jgi:hypothetical protein